MPDNPRSFPTITRRQVLGVGAATGAAAVAQSLLPASLTRAIAASPRSGRLSDIKHVVLLMQENRSFDHYFGSLRGVRGFADRTAVAQRNGRPVFEQVGPDGTVLPFLAKNAANRAGRSVQDLGSLDHSWDGGHAANDVGWNDGWVPAKSPSTMASLDRTDLPFHYALADAFTICDAYHCSVFSATSPNRNYWVSGYTGFEPAPNQTKRAIENDAYDEVHHTGYTWPTYAELLERAGVSWRVYQEWDNFEDNNIEFFASFKAIMQQVLAATGTGLITLDSFYGLLGRSSPADRSALLARLQAGVEALPAAQRSLYQRGLFRAAPGSLIEEFEADIRAGSLPAVSYIVPSSVDSEHPGGPSSPAASASITFRLLDAIASNPEVWASTAVFINFDENDGYFDHVPPPLPPADQTDEFYEGKAIGLGVRVPMTVVSPWTVGGYVCSEVFDHSSTVQFLERWTGVRAPDISRWRRTVAGDLTSVFDFSGRSRRVSIPPAPPAPPLGDRWDALPPTQQTLPPQEPGTRKARPLPYQPDAEARVDDKNLVVRMRNDGARSAHLVVWPYRGEAPEPIHFDVARVATTSLPVAGTGYSVTVTGPNGFIRTFTGAQSEQVAVSSRVRHDDGLVVTLANSGTTTATFLVTRTGRDGGTKPMTVRPGERRDVPIDVEKTSGWYDVSVGVTGLSGFARRLAGHVENGRESITG